MSSHPRARPDLRIHVQQGDHAVHVQRPDSPHFVRLQGSELTLLQYMDGRRGVVDLEQEMAQRGLYMPAAAIAQFVDRCGKLGLLANQEATPPGSRPWIARVFGFKVPLLDPDPWLAGPARVWSLLWSRWAAVPSAVLLLSAAYLVLHDLPRVLRTAHASLTPAGIPWIIATVIAVKLLHELGHAAAARRHRCRVPEAGVAVLCLLPCLYVDTTSGWSLPSRRQRIEIALAGLWVELMIAAVATHIWFVTTPGVLQGVAFHLMAISWTMSILVNANPLMRFDGYYVAADLLRQPNLAHRARARLEFVFWSRWMGLAGPSDPARSRGEGRLLLAYAVSASCWKLFLGLVIARAVYERFIPILGLALAAGALWMFVVAPLLAAVRRGWKVRRQLRPRALPVTALAGALLTALLVVCVPVTGHRVYTCVVEARQPVTLVAPRDGRLAEVFAQSAAAVQKDQILAALHTEDLTFAARLADVDLALAQHQLERHENDRESWLEATLAIPEVEAAEDRRQRVREDLAASSVRAPRAGRIVEWDSTLSSGATVRRGQRLGEVADPAFQQARALVSQREVDVLSVGQAVEIWLPLPQTTWRGTISRIDRSPVTALSDERLGARAGGEVFTQSQPQAGRTGDADSTSASPAEVPAEPHYHVIVDLEEGGAPFGMTGRLRVPAARRPIVAQVYDAVLRHMYREVLF